MNTVLETILGAGTIATNNQRPCHRKPLSPPWGQTKRENCPVMVCSSKTYKVKEGGREEWRCIALYRWSEKTSGIKGHLRDTKERKKRAVRHLAKDEILSLGHV